MCEFLSKPDTVNRFYQSAIHYARYDLYPLVLRTVFVVMTVSVWTVTKKWIYFSMLDVKFVEMSQKILSRDWFQCQVNVKFTAGKLWLQRESVSTTCEGACLWKIFRMVAFIHYHLCISDCGNPYQFSINLVVMIVHVMFLWPSLVWRRGERYWSFTALETYQQNYTRKHSSRMHTAHLPTSYQPLTSQEVGDPLVDVLEQVSSLGHQMSLADEAGAKGVPVHWSPMLGEHGWWGFTVWRCAMYHG